MISISNLTKSYGNFIALNGISVEIPTGSTHAFLGENGAGKTTTLKILTGLTKPSSGEVKIFDMDISSNRIDIAKRMGVLIETPGFIPNLTGKQILTQLSRLQGQFTKDYIDELLHTVGLQDAGPKKVKDYSTGMRQRLGLAQALIGEPELLLLDEPFSGLDISGTLEIKKLLTNLNKKDGVTIFLSSHRLREIDKLCSDVVLIRNGMVVTSGKVQDLIQGNTTQRAEVSDLSKAEDALRKYNLHFTNSDGNWLNIEPNGYSRNQIAELFHDEGVIVYYLTVNDEMTLEDFYLLNTQEVVA